MAVWDISAQPAGDQFGYWHDVICQVFVPLTPKRTVRENGFAGRVEARPMATMNRARIHSQPQRTEHGPREVSRSDGEFYFVNLQLTGRCLAQQGSRISMVEPGQFTVVDTTEPYYLDFDSQWEMLSFRIARDQLQHRLSPSRRAGAVDGSSGTGGVAASLMRSLWELKGPASRSDLLDLEQAFLAVVTVAAGTLPRTDDHSLHEGLRAGVLLYVHTNLGDPALTVSGVCQRFAISPRLLHRLFQNHEYTFAEMVRILRLQRCAELLADPAGTGTITQIAARCGFPDPATFSRAFRRHFGIAPRDLRDGSG
jgi:AraC-like DNA-binding protein